MIENSQKGFIVPIIGSIIAIIIVIGSIAYLANKPTKDTNNSLDQEGTMMNSDDKLNDDLMMEEDDGNAMKNETESESMMTNDNADGAMMTYSGSILAGNSAPLLDFNKSDYDAALKTDKLMVLYFYANWCPICRAEFPLMQQAFNNLNSDKVIGFRVNYNDNETDASEKDLARQFGVAYQHTKIFVKNNNRILKSPEGWDTNKYTNEINKIINQ